MNTRYLCTLSLLLLFFGCSATKRSPNSGINQVQYKSESPKDSVSPVVYNLIVSFFSTHAGIDGKARAKFLDYKNSFEHFEMTKIGVEEVHWGREGEIDYCMKLEELYATQFVRFIDGLKETMKDFKSVRIYEKSICLHKK